MIFSPGLGGFNLREGQSIVVGNNRITKMDGCITVDQIEEEQEGNGVVVEELEDSDDEQKILETDKSDSDEEIDESDDQKDSEDLEAKKLVDKQGDREEIVPKLWNAKISGGKFGELKHLKPRVQEIFEDSDDDDAAPEDDVILDVELLQLIADIIGNPMFIIISSLLVGFLAFFLYDFVDGLVQ